MGHVARIKLIGLDMSTFDNFWCTNPELRLICLAALTVTDNHSIFAVITVHYYTDTSRPLPPCYSALEIVRFIIILIVKELDTIELAHCGSIQSNSSLW